jgi:hypothetical protein
MSDCEKMLKMKQDDEIKLCKEIDALRSTVAALEAKLEEMKESWNNARQVAMRAESALAQRTAVYAKDWELWNTELAAVKKERDALKVERDTLSEMFETQAALPKPCHTNACVCAADLEKRVREEIDNALQDAAEEAMNYGVPREPEGKPLDSADVCYWLRDKSLALRAGKEGA